MLPPEISPGNGPFVFVSYSHKDAEQVYPDILSLQQAGISVWYDEGLEPGREWYKSVDEHVCMNNCVGTIFFTSDDFIRSKSCGIEMDCIHRHQTRYFAVNLLGISPFKHAKKLYKADKLVEDEDTADDLYSCIKALFHKDIT